MAIGPGDLIYGTSGQHLENSASWCPGVTIQQAIWVVTFSVWPTGFFHPTPF